MYTVLRFICCLLHREAVRRTASQGEGSKLLGGRRLEGIILEVVASAVLVPLAGTEVVLESVGRVLREVVLVREVDIGTAVDPVTSVELGRCITDHQEA